MIRRARHATRPYAGGLLVVAVVALAGCQVTVSGPTEQAPSSAPVGAATQSGTSPGSQAGLVVVHDPGRVTGTCHYRDGGQLPDPRCTPGSIDPAVTQATCGRRTRPAPTPRTRSKTPCTARSATGV